MAQGSQSFAQTGAKEAIVTYLNKAFRQNVLQEAADEFLGRTSRNLARKMRESAFTGSTKLFLEGRHVPSTANPPPGTR